MLQQATDDVEEDILEVEWTAMEGKLGEVKDPTGKGITFVGVDLRRGRSFAHQPTDVRSRA